MGKLVLEIFGNVFKSLLDLLLLAHFKLLSAILPELVLLKKLVAIGSFKVLAKQLALLPLLALSA